MHAMRTFLQRLAIGSILLMLSGLMPRLAAAHDRYGAAAGSTPQDAAGTGSRGFLSSRQGTASAVAPLASPSTTVGAFYTALDAKDFETAYGLLSPAFQAAHPFAAWAAGYASTEAIGFDVSVTQDPSAVWVYLTAIDSTPDLTERATRFIGYWHLVPRPDETGWLLDSAAIGAAAEPLVYALPAADYAAFADAWYHHGIALTVDSNGNGTASWRTYQRCSDGPPPCDAMAGNAIVDGGQGRLVFASQWGSSAIGSVHGSTEPSVLDPAEPITLTLLPFDMAVLVQHGSVLVLCGSNSDEERPQAVQVLCGA
jgi:hypothetical protein